MRDISWRFSPFSERRVQVAFGIKTEEFLVVEDAHGLIIHCASCQTSPDFGQRQYGWEIPVGKKHFQSEICLESKLEV